MFLPNEKKDVKKVVEYGKRWGYGNLIDRLRMAWALSLMETTDLDCSSIEVACGLTNGRLTGKREDTINFIKEYIGQD